MKRDVARSINSSIYPDSPTDPARWLQPGSRFQQLQLDQIDWPEDTFTIEAVAHLDSIHKDAKVNTLLSRWNGSHSDTGWAFGITSEKSAISRAISSCNLSARTFRTTASTKLSLQPSPPLLKPVYLAASIRAVPGKDDVTKGEITFFLKDLSDPDAPLQTQTVSHQIVGGLKTGEDVLSLIGTHPFPSLGRQLTRLVIGQALKLDQLLVSLSNAPRLIDWNFSGPKDNPQSPTPTGTPPSAKSTLRRQPPPWLTSARRPQLNGSVYLRQRAVISF